MKIGNYVIVDKIATNHTKTIYRVKNDKGQQYIIKQLNFVEGNKQEFIKLKKEAQILESLDPQFVIKCIEIGEYEGCPYLVMEDKGDISLKSYLKEYNVDIPDFVSMAIGMAENTNHAHINNIIHADINPSNFIIDLMTHKIWLNDFGVSEYFHKNMRFSSIDHSMMGTIEYISPEQTGRINAVIDMRTDIYALGVTFYEMCTGKLPFKADDLLSNVHLHIAVMPAQPHQVEPNVPRQISKIIMKMLSKDPINRYQSLFGLIDDLRICQKSLSELGSIGEFECGTTDRYSYFAYPPRIFGRTVVLQEISSRLKRGAHTTAQILLIEGESGVGKTYIINRYLNERKDCTLITGTFSSGMDNPFSAFVEAIRSFLNSQLMETDEYIAALSEEIHESIGADASVLIYLIPELKRFILHNKQIEDTLDVGFLETQFRFHIQFAKLLQLIIQRENQLVLVLDNIQYIDDSSYLLLEYLLEKADLSKLNIIGLAHPHMEYILYKNLRDKCNDHLNYKLISMKGYEHQDIQDLIFELFSFDESQSQVLADVLMNKTRGIPLFVYEMLKGLYLQNIVYFDLHMAKWTYDINSVMQTQISQNVIEFVLNRVQKLAEEYIDVLKVASCFEHEFNLHLLKKVGGYQKEQLMDALTILIDNEFLEYDGSINDLIFFTPKYDEQLIRFSHENIRSVVNHILEPEREQMYQFRIGLAYLSQYKKAGIPDDISRIVKCFNLSRKLVTDKVLSKEVAELNYLLAYQARSSAAFEQAENYISNATYYLDDIAFETQYELAFRVFLLKAEIEYLTKLFKRAESDFDYLLQQAKTDFDYARINKLRLTLYVNQGETDKVIELAIKTLKRLGITIKENGSIRGLGVSLFSIRLNSKFKSVDALETLPECTDVRIRLIMEILMTLISVSYLFSKLLFIQIILTMIELSLKHGNVEYSSFAYASYGILEGNVFGHYKRGYAFGEMSIRLAKKYRKLDVLSKTYFTMGFFLNHWECHIRESLPFLVLGRNQSEKCGDMVYFAYNVAAYHLAKISSSTQLETMLDEINRDLKKINEVQVYDITNLLICVRQMVLNLKGRTKHNTRFDSDDFDQNYFELSLKESNMPSIWAVYLVMKAKVHYIFDYDDEAEVLFEDGDRLFSNLLGLFQSVEYRFYQTMTLLRKNPKDLRIKKNIKVLKKYATVSPSNFEHMYLIAKAECYRVSGDFDRAKHLFDQGLKVSHLNDFVLEEALCCELMAFIYAQEANVKLRKIYLYESYNLFARMGATARLRHMEMKYKEAVFQIKENTLYQSKHGLVTNSVKASTEIFDLLSIVKSTQSISAVLSEVELVDEALKIILQNSNADRGILMIKEDQLNIRAIIEGESNVYSYNHEPVKGSGLLPESLINYVLRTEEPVLIEHIEISNAFNRDDYFSLSHAKSVLCIPLLHKDNLFGLMYLENSLLFGAFGYNRLESLNVILSQFVISYENARLIGSLEKSEAEIRFHKDHLEELVSQRTSELSIAKSDIEEIMNNVEQGFMQFDQDGKILDGYSRECVKIFGHRLEGMKFDSLFNQGSKMNEPGFYTKIIKKVFEVDHDFSAEVYMGLLPETLILNGRSIQIHYKLVRNIFYKRIVVVMTDMTDRIRLEKEKEAEKQNLYKIVNIIKYKGNLKKNIEGYKRFFQQGYKACISGVCDPVEMINEIYRIVHTFKGDFAQWSMTYLSESLHALESDITQLSRKPEYSCESILELIENFNSEEVLDREFERVFEYTGRSFLDGEEIIEISRSQLADVFSDLQSELTPKGKDLFADMIKRMQYVNVKDLILQYQAYAHQQAKLMQKEFSGIFINGDDIYIDRDYYYDFFRSLIHVIRNIIQYAIEIPEIRQSYGKTSEALITCDVQYTSAGFELIIADDGAGIDSSKIKEKAFALGLIDDSLQYTDEELVAFIFNHGFTTSDKLTELSGRGIGLSVVKDEVDKLGGTIQVKTVLNEGTQFIFSIPLKLGQE